MLTCMQQLLPPALHPGREGCSVWLLHLLWSVNGPCSLVKKAYMHVPPCEAALCVHDPHHHRSTGVFIGISQLEYARLTLEQDAPMSAYYATGAHLSVTAGRISYTWGLAGPALAVDTACSSSLVTAHLAVAALTAGEVEVAAAGGVNLTLAASWSLACNRAGTD